MVGLGFLMLFIALMSLFLRYKQMLYNQKWFLKLCIVCAPIGFISIITGWFTAEFGRQPWIIYNYVRTIDAHSPIALYQVLISFVSIILVYGVIFGYFYFRYFFATIAAGPEELATEAGDQTFFYMSPPMGKSETKKGKGKHHE